MRTQRRTTPPRADAPRAPAALGGALGLALLSAQPRPAAASPGAAPPCLDLLGPIERIEAQVIAGELGPIPQLVAEAEAAVSCAEQLPPAQLARLFRAEGAWLSLLGAHEEATLAFASAARLAPGRWSPTLPAAMEAPFRAASAREAELGVGTLQVEGPRPGAAVIEVNGQAVGPRSDLPAGLHTVRIRGEEGRSAHLVMIYEGEVVVVEPPWRSAAAAPAPLGEATPTEAPPPAPPPVLASLPLPEPAPPRAAPAPLPDAPRPVGVGVGPGRPWWIAAGGAAVGAGLTAVVARAQIGRAAEASTLGQVEQARRTQLVAGISSYGLMLGTGALLTVGFTR